MTHHDEGKYALKHPPDTHPDPGIAEAINANQRDGRMTCATATRLSGELGVSMAEIGRNADLLEIRIHKCILGLFGRRTPGGDKRPITPAEFVSEEMKGAVLSRLEDGRLSCAAAWEIAEEQGVSRGSIAGICEALKVKIFRCQLGAF